MSQPVIILVNPQLGENIGACARAMLNCNLTELRLVKPRDGWPSESALANASGADALINNAKLYETTQEAIADLQLVYATSARQFSLNKPIDDLEQAAQTLVESDLACGVLFGPERTGLHGDDVALASRLLTIPLNPSFSSLNIAQAVLLVAYGWHRAQGLAQPQLSPRIERQQPATQEQVEGMIEHFTRELVWLPELQRHANGATGLAAVALVADNVAYLAGVYGRVFGAWPERIDEGLKVATGGAPLAFCTRQALQQRLRDVVLPERALPHAAALFIHVADRQRAYKTLHDGGFSPRRMPDGSWAIDATDAHGVAMVFG